MKRRARLTVFQTRTIDLPSDSNFALLMRSQQAAEREEQQRIKNLVLNYELHDVDQHDGNEAFALMPIVQPSLESKKFAKPANTGYDHFSGPFSRAERHVRAPRARRLNLSDVDWYAHQSGSSSAKAGQENDSKSAQIASIAQKKPG